MKWLSRFFPQTIAGLHSSVNRDIKIIKTDAHVTLLVNGIEQSGEYVERLFSHAFKKVKGNLPGSVRRVLILGIGGGVVIRMLRDIYPETHITVVDVDPMIVKIARKYFALGDVENVSCIVADAKTYMRKQTRGRSLFDLIIVDIFVGNDVPDFVTGKRFLMDAKKHMRLEGGLLFNYFSYFNQPEKSTILLETLSKIFQTVVPMNILRNKFFYCLSGVRFRP